jgi:hypothetical protein
MAAVAMVNIHAAQNDARRYLIAAPGKGDPSIFY